MIAEKEHGANSAATLELENFLPYRLNRLADAVSREFQKIYKGRYGLTRPEWRLLATLGQYGTMTATEARNWLARETDRIDRRIERLSLTKTGERTYREMVPLARAFETGLLSGLNPSDRQALLAGLDALERGLAD